MNDLQSKELEILLHIDKLCKKYKINYYLIGGSTIGAVRHKGFIPWDDDIDIAIMKKDEQRFIDMCVSEFKNDYFFQSQQTDKNYILPFYKIRANNTTCIEEYMKKIDMHHGVYIDVFILYSVPNSKILRYLEEKSIFLYSRLLADTIKSKKWFNNFLLLILEPFSNKIKNKLKKIIDWIDAKADLNHSNNISNIFGTIPYKTSIMPKDYFGTPKYMEFENNMLPVPEKYHKYLTHIFGDYMQLPPEDKRNSGHIFLYVDVQKDYKEYIKIE